MREENKQIKNGKRYPKYWGQAKVTSFMVDVVVAKEAERLRNNRIKCEGKVRRVSVLRKGESGKQRTSPATKTLAQ